MSPDSIDILNVACTHFLLNLSVRLRGRTTNVLGLDRLSIVYDHAAGGDAQRGIRGGDFRVRGTSHPVLRLPGAVSTP
jgi:hypothetical protein